MTSKKIVVVALTLLAISSAVYASNFRAADTVYLPSAGRVPSGTKVFITDAYITNLTTSNVVIQVAFGTTGAAADNSQITAAANLKTISPNLAPGERRLISDITHKLFPEKDGTLGYLVFFACKEGGNCTNCDANPADCSLISVEGRIYSRDAANAAAGTSGQLFPGYPWYAFVSPNDAALGLDKVFVIGLRNEGTRPTSGYRSNFGVLNASQDYDADVKVSVFSGTGTLVGEKTYTIKALGHIQTTILDAAPSLTTNDTTAYAIVSMVASRLVAGGDATTAPGFFTFGSILDNQTDDPTTLESQYTQQLDIRCVYGSKASRHPIRKK